MLQSVIKQMCLGVITNPYNSTGQPKFLLKFIDLDSPSSILSLFTYTHSTVRATAWLGTYVLFKQSILIQKQRISLILKPNSCNKIQVQNISSFNISKFDFER